MDHMEPYQAWARRYAVTFGLTKAEDAGMLAEWCRQFAQAGYQAWELEGATDWLALNPPAHYRSDHLKAVLGRLREQRAALVVRPPEPDHPRGTCDLCGDSGRVVVPRWPPEPSGHWYTWAVLCRCPLGRWYGERLANRSPLTLDSYERQNPDWRRQVEAHEAEQRLHLRGVREAGALDQVFGQLIRRARREVAE